LENSVSVVLAAEKLGVVDVLVCIEVGNIDALVIADEP
jgi:hypothetical protein